MNPTWSIWNRGWAGHGTFRDWLQGKEREPLLLRGELDWYRLACYLGENGGDHIFLPICRTSVEGFFERDGDPFSLGEGDVVCMKYPA